MSEETKNIKLTDEEYIKKLENAIEDLNNHCDKLQQENQQLKEENRHLKEKQIITIKAMEFTRDIIKQQPSSNPNEDKFIIEKLNYYIKLLGGNNNE